MARPGEAGQGTARQGVARPSVAWPGQAWQGRAWQGKGTLMLNPRSEPTALRGLGNSLSRPAPGCAAHEEENR